jgi:hypothetical protein
MSVPIKLLENSAQVMFVPLRGAARTGRKCVNYWQ